MIDRQLPRLPWSPVRGTLKIGECFALCYLAKYNTNGIETRSRTSFERAYAMNILKRVASVPGGRPGYVVAIWNDPGLTRITVAIEGMRTYSQLQVAWEGFNTSLVAGTPGRVLAAFQTHADTIKAELLADDDFTEAFNRNNVGLTLTGFSLGAAIAEVMSVKFQQTHPNRQYQLSKFASPKVGNASWVNRTQFPSDRNSFYLRNDPIWNYPYVTLNNINNREFIWTQGFTIFAKNDPAVTYNMQGVCVQDQQNDSLLHNTRSSISGLGAVNPDNVWYYHKSEAYRLMLFNDTYQFPTVRDEAQARFMHLEFQDDNNWFRNYSVGQETFEGLTELADPAPADTEVPVVAAIEAQLVTNAQRTHTQTLPVPNSQDNAVFQGLPQGAWRPRRTRDF